MAARVGMINRVGPRAATAYINVAGDFSSLHKGIAAESAGLTKRGNLLGKSIAVGVGAGLAAGAGLFKVGEMFDAEADKIRVGTGKTGKALKGLQKDFKAVVQDVPTDFDSAGTAITGLSQRLDLTGKPLRRLTKQVTELSRITGTDVGENVESLTRLFGDWSIKTDKQSATLDKLFRLSQRTGIGISDLSRFMVQFGSPLRQLGLDFDFSAAMFARFEKEGVNIQTLMPGLRFALKTFSREGREPAKALRETFEAIEQAGGAAEANQIAFETFGVRAGPDMAAAIREGRFDLDELMRSMRRGKDTVLGAAEDTKDLSERWIEFRNRALVKLEPVATRVFNRVGVEADKLFDILENPRLTTDEKIERISQRLSDGIAQAIPALADRAAEMAPRVASAFVTGWLNAGIWGRLLVGGWLLAKLGGIKAFSAMGTQAGAAFAAGAAGGGGAAGAAAKGGLLGALFGKLGGVRGLVGKAGLVGLGAAIFGPELAKPFLRESKTMQDALRDLDGRARATAQGGFGAYTRALRQQIRLAREAGTSIDRDVGDSLERFSRKTFEISDRIERMSNDSSRSIRELRTRVAFNTKEIRERLGTDTKLGKDALVDNFQAAARNVRRSMREGTISTKRGTALIEEYMVKALQNMGFSKADAIALRKRTPGSTQTPMNGELRPHQRGGYIDMGAPTGDSVAALLERDEYVLNRKAVRRIGRRTLDRINFGLAPRFQGGGIVELLHPGNDPDHQDHLHIAMLNGIVALGRKLQRMGWLVSEHPAFGGVNFSHASGSHHYNADAIDVNWPDASQERSKIAALLPLLSALAGGALGAVAPKLARLIATGPDSPLKSLVQSALDTTHAAAQDVVNRAASPLEGAEFADTNGPIAQIAQQMVAGRFGASQWPPFLELKHRESGPNWDPTITNPSSGAGGIPQALPPSKMGSPAWPPTQGRKSIIAQLSWMVDYISGRYGSPSAALAFHDAHNWYRQGGLVGMQWGGDPFASPGWGGGGARGSSPSGLVGRLHNVLGRFGAVDEKGRPVLGRKGRGKLLRNFLKRIKGIGLPASLEKRIKTLTEDAEIFGDMAGRAGQLTIEGPNGEQILGQVDGKTEADWLTRQLETLFKLRNKLVQAEEIVVRKRDAVTRLIEAAQKRLGRVAEAIRTAAKVRHGLEQQLETARKKPHKNRELIKSLRGKISDIDRDQGVRVRERNALKNRILPALGGKRSSLNTARGDILSGLEEVQGVGSPTEKLGALPAVGVLGGQIFDVQMRLRELAAPTSATDTTATDDGGRADLLEQLLREANLRTAVSQAQYDVFKNMPPFGGSFADGGVVPGPPGAPRTIIAHGGEIVTDAADASRIRVVIEDNRVRVFENDVERAVERVTRRQASAASRGLAGLGGGRR